MFDCRISVTSSQLIIELFPDCLKVMLLAHCFLNVFRMEQVDEITTTSSEHGSYRVSTEAFGTPFCHVCLAELPALEQDYLFVCLWD